MVVPSETVKRCFRCGSVKSLDRFYRHPKMADGFLGKCKECTRIDVAKNRHENAERCREYDRQRSQTEERKAARKRYADSPLGKAREGRRRESLRRRRPVRYRASIVTSHAIRDGKLIRQPCEICGEGVVQAHHEDYSKPLDVRWLCLEHHRARHRELRALAAARGEA